MALVINKSFCEEVEGRYIAIDGVTTKKSASIWPIRDCTCDACDKFFTQCHSLHEHKKYACKQLETQKRPKEMLQMW